MKLFTLKDLRPGTIVKQGENFGFVKKIGDELKTYHFIGKDFDMKNFYNSFTEKYITQFINFSRLKEIKEVTDLFSSSIVSILPRMLYFQEERGLEY